MNELVITIVKHDGTRTVETCASGKLLEVAVGKRLRFVVESEDPWYVRLLDRDHVLDEWTLPHTTSRSISVNVRPTAACAYLCVRDLGG